MSDWWSRRLSDNSPPPVSSTPPVTPPMRTAIHIPQQSAVVANPTAQIQPQERVLDPSKGPQDQITMGDALRLWKGGEAARKETGSCPECGSNLVFSRSKGTTVNGASPAPRCYECGWNGRYSQADQSNWA